MYSRVMRQGQPCFVSLPEKYTKDVSVASQASGRRISAKSTASPTNTGAGEERTMTCEKGEDFMPILCGSVHLPQ